MQVSDSFNDSTQDGAPEVLNRDDALYAGVDNSAPAMDSAGQDTLYREQTANMVMP